MDSDSTKDVDNFPYEDTHAHPTDANGKTTEQEKKNVETKDIEKLVL